MAQDRKTVSKSLMEKHKKAYLTGLRVTNAITRIKIRYPTMTIGQIIENSHFIGSLWGASDEELAEALEKYEKELK